MTALRRLAIGFPLEWNHSRAYCLSGLSNPGAGPYYIEWNPDNGTYGEDWDGATRDAGGVLQTGKARVYHPIRIAQFALHRYGVWYRNADQFALGDFFSQAVWLRDNQTLSGTYTFSFPWLKYGAPAGWSSAMAQGEAVSVLLRAAHLQPGHGFSDAAQRAALAFYYDISAGGVVWRDGPDVFFEEIANRHAPHVLNGCIFALWGVWELWRSSGDPALLRVAEECAETIRRWLPRFDTGWWTLYSLMKSAGGRPHLATLKYHEFHTAQMRVMAKMFDDPSFDAAADRWAGYAERQSSRRRLMLETFGSLSGRLLKRDTVAGGAHT